MDSTKGNAGEVVVEIDPAPALKRGTPQHLAVFINAYIPEENKETRVVTAQNALQILREQIGQINNSYAQKHNVSVNLVTVGRDFDNNSNIVDKLCADTSGGWVKCIPHSGGSGELDTLQLLHNYCLTAPDTARAIYIHNKGSFHPSPKNDRWRRSMTDAVVSEGCLNPPNSSCNACGLLFEAPPRLFTLLFPGNFFAASCQYIKRLLPPLYFEERHTEAVQRAIRTSLSSDQFYFSKYKKWSLGLKRFTSEHWIGSHPSIRPCDVSVEEDYWYWENHDHSVGEFQWSMFPRRAYNASHEFAMNVSYLDMHDIRLRYYDLLPGLLYLWRELYNSTPPESSWIWSWLPDGSLWKEAVELYGLAAVDVVTGPDFNRTQAGLSGRMPSALSTTG